MRFKKLQRLSPGDIIRLIAPASVFQKESFLIARKNLEKLGFIVSYSKNIFHRYGNFAGKDEIRAQDFMESIEDTKIRALYCIRGGYGSAKIVPYLDSNVIKKNPKILIGFSDITFLHAYFQKLKIPSFHAPVLLSGFKSPSQEFINEFTSIFMKNELACVYGDVFTKVMRHGVGEGRVVGGNLSLLISTLGTPYEIDTDNAILVIEDLDEAPYRIDRMLTQLALAGKFTKLHGLIIGEFKNCISKKHYSLSLKDIVKNITKDYTFPILYNFPIGHNNKRNRIIILGVRGRMNTHDWSLQYLELPLRD